VARWVWTLGIWAFANPAWTMEVSEAWVRATVPGQTVAAAYLTLRSPTSVQLVAVRSEIARRVEIHSSNMDEGTMRMRQMKSLAIPAGQSVTLTPMGTHLMLMDLRAPLKAGTQVLLELVIEEKGKRTTFKTNAVVKPLTE